jgi:hypothetical protein
LVSLFLDVGQVSFEFDSAGGGGEERVWEGIGFPGVSEMILCGPLLAPTFRQIPDVIVSHFLAGICRPCGFADPSWN